MNAGSEILRNFQVYIIGPAILLLFTAGLLLFMVGLVEFLWKLRQGTDIRQGVQHMIWGIVGMFIMVSVGGILNIVESVIGADPRSPDVGRLENIQATQYNLFNFQ